MEQDQLGVSPDPFDPFALQQQITLVFLEQFFIIFAVACNPYSWVPDYSLPLMQQKTRLLLE